MSLRDSQSFHFLGVAVDGAGVFNAFEFLEPLEAFADTGWQVKRSTQSLELDTVRQLVAKQKFSEALEYCETQIGQYPASSLYAAKWAVEHSRVLVAMASEEQIFDEIAANQSTGPIVALLESYPEHD